MIRNILIVDDEPDMLKLLKRSLEPDLNCRVQIVSSGDDALRIISQHPFDLILADIKMPGMDGLELLARVKKQYPDITVVMMTGHGSIETAVIAMQNGAYDFITKPFDHDALVVRLEKALERSSLLKENRRLKKACENNQVLDNFIGQSAPMQRVFETIRTVANTDLTVFITGESGVGKDLTAQAVHALSDRNDGPFIAINCPTIPEHILESELFGYKKGAFTHATQNKIGLFQEAQHGSIFLDEIGDISPMIQTKLLRVLQEKEIKPLGDTRTVKVDVRIIASTNQDLKEKIKQGLFREDFFYRLNVLPIHLPPLRERREDIPLIINYLLEKHCQKLKKPLKTVSPALMELFMHRDWKGNVREMENLLIQGILFSNTNAIMVKDINVHPEQTRQTLLDHDVFSAQNYKDAKEAVLREFNELFIGDLLKRNKGNVTHAANECGLERQSLQQVMRRYDIKADDYRN